MEVENHLHEVYYKIGEMDSIEHFKSEFEWFTIIYNKEQENVRPGENKIILFLIMANTT